jgi:hypothetical protein
VNERQLAAYLTKNGQPLLPMVELIEQPHLAIEELIDVVGCITSAGAAGIKTRIGNHTFRATGITAYLENSSKLGKSRSTSPTTSRRGRRSFTTGTRTRFLSTKWKEYHPIVLKILRRE